MESKDLYSYYSAEKVKSGLTFSCTEFFLNEKPFQIFSGSLHYFRFHPNSWKENIKKMRHCHLNTVSTYIPWNLHEDKPGIFNFSYNLDLKAFIELVKEEDMFLIVRVGPYICAEIDFGGLPSWLLKDKHMKLRTNYAPYLDSVKRYFSELIALMHKYQFSVSGGPIIAVQVENEYGSYGNTQDNTDDFEYMVYIKNLLIDLGIKELLFTCDMPSIGFLKGSVPEVLMTANFQTDVEKELEILKNLQPDKPLMVAELWSGWFDNWGGKHEEISVDVYTESLKLILNKNASFNIYVFQGGTNFGFSNGANAGFPLPETPYSSTVTSYDYGALLTESGVYTEKYFVTLNLLKSFQKEYQRPECILNINSTYLHIENLPVKKHLPLNKMLPLVEKIQCPNPLVMEELGQRFGFTLYTTKFDKNGVLTFYMTQGVRIVVFVNNVVISVIESTHGFQSVHLKHSVQNEDGTLWILVENLGRINFAEKSEILNNEQRGIVGPTMLDEILLNNWTVYILDFDKKFINDVTLIEWEEIEASVSALHTGLYGATFDLVDIKDAFIFSSTWNKGIVIVNGFNIGRYWKVGPQQTLFLPKHLLKEGRNEIFAFELHSKVTQFQLKDFHVFDITSRMKNEEST